MDWYCPACGATNHEEQDPIFVSPGSFYLTCSCDTRWRVQIEFYEEA